MNNTNYNKQLVKRTRFFFACCLFLVMVLPTNTDAQQDIEGLSVETYYVSDDNDATDFSGLAVGSITYRVYLDLGEGCKLKRIFATENHAVKVESTANFFNHFDRGELFGFDINDGVLEEGTVPLDSWFGFGFASDEHFGILKTDDADGSVVGGANNDGGSESIAGGLLVNEDVSAGIPLTQQDGLMNSLGATTPVITVAGDSPASVFDTETIASSYITNSLQMVAGDAVIGQGEANMLLIAQFTTTGEISFELNVEIEKEDGETFLYVANDDILLPDEFLSPYLKFPGECGCQDPNFLEYDPGVVCDDGSCLTPIILGCMDTLACNYDPLVNFNVQELCCILPDNCEELDPDLICPGADVSESFEQGMGFVVFPNPFTEQLRVKSSGADRPSHFELYDAFGRKLISGSPSQQSEFSIDTSQLSAGLYLLKVYSGSETQEIRMVKN
jgi:hypothetical protein